MILHQIYQFFLIGFFYIIKHYDYRIKKIMINFLSNPKCEGLEQLKSISLH